MRVKLIRFLCQFSGVELLKPFEDRITRFIKQHPQGEIKFFFIDSQYVSYDRFSEEDYEEILKDHLNCVCFVDGIDHFQYARGDIFLSVPYEIPETARNTPIAFWEGAGRAKIAERLENAIHDKWRESQNE